jgi:hypothetical protein
MTTETAPNLYFDANWHDEDDFSHPGGLGEIALWKSMSTLEPESDARSASILHAVTLEKLAGSKFAENAGEEEMQISKIALGLALHGWELSSFALTTHSFDIAAVRDTSDTPDTRHELLTAAAKEACGAKTHLVVSRPLYSTEEVKGEFGRPLADYARNEQAKKAVSTYSGPYLTAYINSYGAKKVFVLFEDRSLLTFEDAHDFPWEPETRESMLELGAITSEEWSSLEALEAALHNKAVSHLGTTVETTAPDSPSDQ